MTENWQKLDGLLAATLTPFDEKGAVNYDIIPRYVDHLSKQVNGTAAEHASLTLEERMKLTEAWMKHKNKIKTIVVHCGAGNLADTKVLVEHAEANNAQCIAVVLPTYFKASSIEAIVQYCKDAAAAAPNTPFMYYHIPMVTGINFRLVDILRAMDARIPTLIGAKCTSMDLYDCGESIALFNKKYDIVLGAETILNSAMTMGVRSAIGIAFSVIGRPCNRIVDNYTNGEYAKALNDQYMVHKFWSASHKAGDLGNMIASFKHILSNMMNESMGAPRLPLLPLSDEEKLHAEVGLTDIGFADWIAN